MLSQTLILPRGFRPPSAALRTVGAPTLRSYDTQFAANESPITEGGNWVAPATGWQSPQTSGGLAFTPVAQSGFDDAARFMAGSWARDQQVELTINLESGYASGGSPTGSHEIECLLSMSKPDATHMLGYECLLGYSSGGGGWYTQIMLWNGTVSETYYSELDSTKDSSFTPPVHNDLFRCNRIGNTIRAYIVHGGTANLINTSTAASGAILGAPGMSFFMNAGGGAVNNKYCASRFRCTEL